ncbi:MAG: NAD(P)-dependent oxidoreductase, partial [Paracoccaceae bacterium]
MRGDDKYKRTAFTCQLASKSEMLPQKTRIRGENQRMSDISVIGLGVMGSALARALLRAGYAVTVWNRSSDKTEPLVAEGASAADSAKNAIAASPATITCIASHDKTLELLKGTSGALPGKTIIELSTGSAKEAKALSQMISDSGGDWMIGIINAYPTAVGKPETVLLTVGAEDSWKRWEPAIKVLGGSSAHVGTEAAMLAALFAALFTTR